MNIFDSKIDVIRRKIEMYEATRRECEDTTTCDLEIQLLKSEILDILGKSHTTPVYVR